MPKFTYWKSGDYNAICDSCGVERKASELIDRWDGFKVCPPTLDPGCWEPRHPQELIRPVNDQNKLKWTRPGGEDQFITGYCTILGRQAKGGYAVAGCAIAGFETAASDSFLST